MARKLTAWLITILILILVHPAIFAQDDALPPPGPTDVEEMPAEPPEEVEMPPPPPPVPDTWSPPRTPTREAQPTEEAPLVEETPQPTESLAPVLAGSGRNWSMFMGDPAHSGYTDERLNFPLKLAWKRMALMAATEIGKQNPSSPVVADGVVYICAGHRLYAVNAETGSLKWAYPAQESLPTAIKSTPLVGDDLVYFAGGDGWLYAVKKETGTLAWNFITASTITSSPILADGVIYVGSGDDHLYALDAQSGNPKWPGGFHTLDDVAGSPAVVDGLVYFLSGDMVLYAALVGSGDVKWAVRIGTMGRTASPVVAENTVYLAAGNFVQAYQAKSGRLKWGIQLRTTVTSTPAVANGTLYVGCRNGKLYAFTTAGKLKWSAPVDVGAPIYASPVIAGDTVIVAANKGALVAVDAETGAVKWTYTIFPSSLDYKLKYANVTASPAVSNGALYVLADDGTLYAFTYEMPDNTPPQVSRVVPSRDALMPGIPPVEIAAIFADPGSGMKTDSISLLLDGEPQEHKLIPERGIVWFKTPVTQPVVPLLDGLHTVTLSLADWAGNKTEMSWYFTVDNRMRQRGTTQPAPGASSSGTSTRSGTR
ncbi:MAG TPA: PQQ-binding-like beta-propeller repeat protein [Armatimonadota bacterium]|nr:PQQ-binding-like beta-propeller repeat protein [Armatimonadota bacterium]